MLPRLMVWFASFVTLLGLVTPSVHATSQLSAAAQSPYTDQVYVPMALSKAPPHLAVRVLSQRRFVNEVDQLLVVGEVINDGPAPVYGVELEATFFDAAGQVIGTANDYALLEQTLPGQRNPFVLFFADDPSLVARHEVHVVGADSTSPFNPRPLSVVSQQTRPNDGVEIFGEIRNATSDALEDTRVVATLRDAAGNVLDVILGFPGRYEMAAGSTSIYTVLSSTPFGSYTVQGEGYVATSSSPAFSLPVASSRMIREEFEGMVVNTVVGEVLNNSAATAYDIELETRFFNAANQLVAVAPGATYLGRSGTGQRNPFELWLANPPANITRHEVVAQAYPKGYLDYRPVGVVSRSVAKTADGTEVSGRLKNTQAVALTDTYAAVTFYDNKGNVVNVAFGYDPNSTGQPIAPNAEVPYVVWTDRTVTYSTYTVQGEGYSDTLVQQQGTQTRAQRVEPQRTQRFTQRQHTRMEPVQRR